MSRLRSCCATAGKRCYFTPTTGDVAFDLRLQYNRETSPRSASSELRQGTGVLISTEQPPDVQILAKKTRSALEDSMGHEEYVFSGRGGHYGHADRFVTVAMRGYQGDDAIEIQQINLEGVEGE